MDKTWAPLRNFMNTTAVKHLGTTWHTKHCTIHWTMHCTTHWTMQWTMHWTTHWITHWTMHCVCTLSCTISCTMHCTMRYTVHCTMHCIMHCTTHFDTIVTHLWRIFYTTLTIMAQLSHDLDTPSGPQSDYLMAICGAYLCPVGRKWQFLASSYR